MSVHVYRRFRALVFYVCWSGLLIAPSSFAKLEWETTSQEIKIHPLQSKSTVHYPFKNTGEKSVTIQELMPDCGCIRGTSDKKTYAPGESGIIDLTFDFDKKQYTHHKTLLVITDDPSEKQTLLSIKVAIPDSYIIPTNQLSWKKREPRSPKSCRLINKHETPLKLSKLVPLKEGVTLELNPIREGFEYEVVAKPTAAAKPGMIPIVIHPEIPEGMTEVKTFTLYAIFFK